MPFAHFFFVHDVSIFEQYALLKTKHVNKNSKLIERLVRTILHTDT